jgi:hypothetical protein
MLLRTFFAALITIAVSATVAWGAPEAICANPAVIFCDNFEDRDPGSSDLLTSKGVKTPLWDMSAGALSSIAVSTDVAFDGTRSLAFKMPACSWSNNQFEGCGAGYMLAPINKSEFYMRHYAYWPAGYVWSPIADKHIAFLNNGGRDRRPWAWHTHPGREPVHDDEPTNETIYRQNANGAAIAYQTGRWYCLEIHLKAGDGNGVIESWIDGVQKWNYTNATLGTTPWTEMMLSGYWNTSPTPGSRGPQTRYFDNLVVSTQRIGCIGTPPGGPPPVAAPPSAPTGVVVR